MPDPIPFPLLDDTASAVPAISIADTMSEFEMAVLATQARAAIGRLRDFIGFHPEEQASLDATVGILGTLIPDRIENGRT